MEFVNRERQLAKLDELLGRDEAQLLVLYGRRRIGKTALINHWLDRQVKASGVYWVAHKSSSAILLDSFARAVQRSALSLPPGTQFSDWQAALEFIFDASRKDTVILAIDEFPYLLAAVPEFASLLQMAWDQRGEDSRLFLVLSGSHYHMMHKEFLAGTGPLYGRSTADMLLEEIEFDQIRHFLPRYSAEQLVEVYSIVGGVPKYLEMWDDRRPVKANIRELILSPVTIFRQEPAFIIQDEISEPRTYMAVLEALGTGLKPPIAIAREVGIANTHVGKYLSTLMDLRFVRRIISVDVRNVGNTRRSRYEIRDPYLQFYYRFVAANLDLLEQDRIDRLMTLITESLPAYVGKTGFEELARRRITVLGDTNQLSFIPERVGRIWTRSVEIDVAAVEKRSRNALLAECKWTSRKTDESTLNSLIERGNQLPKLKDYAIRYALFSKAGFTRKLQQRAKSKGILLFAGPQMDLLT